MELPTNQNWAVTEYGFFSSLFLEGVMVGRERIKREYQSLQATQSRLEMCYKGIIQTSQLVLSRAVLQSEYGNLHGSPE